MSILYLQCDTGLSGGIAGYISSLVTSQFLERYRKVVIVPGAYSDYSVVERLYPHCEVEVLPPTYNLLTFFSYVFSLIKIIRSKNVEVVHAHALRVAVPAVIASIFTRVPVVYTNHGIRFTQKKYLISRIIFQILESFVFCFANKIVCIRTFDFRKMVSTPLFNSSKIVLIKTRIDGFSTVEGAKTRLSGRPLLVGIGSLIEVKRVDRFISWVHALNDKGVHCDAVWIGDGPLRVQLEEDSAALETPIQWVGHLNSEGVHSVLAEASLLFLTSEFEVLPLVVLEAYSLGVPVVSGRFAGVEDFIIDGVTGLLVDPDNEATVAEKVKAVFRDECAFAEIKSNAKDMFSKSFSDREIMAESYSKLYEALMS